MNKQNINIPPLSVREKVLDMYYNDLKSMDHIDALVNYRNRMQVVYKKYNPWMVIRYSKREYFFPKEDYYYED